MSKPVPVVELTADSNRDGANVGLETTADAYDSPPSGHDRAGQLLEGRYSLVRKIDEGGMGVVYEGRHIKLDRRVAVKVMDAKGALAPSRLERFHREAQSLARFHSPHVVSAIDFGTTPDGVPFLVMDYLDGQDLRRILNEFTSLSVERSIKLVGDAIKGVQAAHREGYVHRDLKPENLFVTRNVDGSEHCRVLDFGIVKVPGAPTLTADGGSVGTAGYMAPEQVRGQKQPDVRMDVFALGAILYECVSGKRAISGRSVEDVLLRTMRGEISTPDSTLNVPRELCAIVAKALAFEPGSRYQSVSELWEALRAFSETENVANTTESVGHGRRYSARAVVASAALLAALIITLVMWTWRPQSRFLVGADHGIEADRATGDDSAPDARTARDGESAPSVLLERSVAAQSQSSVAQPSRPSASRARIEHPRPNPSQNDQTATEAPVPTPIETWSAQARTPKRPRHTAETAPVLELEDNPY